MNGLVSKENQEIISYKKDWNEIFIPRIPFKWKVPSIQYGNLSTRWSWNLKKKKFCCNIPWFIYQNVQNKISRNLQGKFWCPWLFLKKSFGKNRTFWKIQKFKVANKYVYNNRCISISKKNCPKWFRKFCYLLMVKFHNIRKILWLSRSWKNDKKILYEL